MERALHPDLAKRGVFVDPNTGKTVMRSVGAEDMVKYTKEGVGKNLEKKDKIVFEILDMFKHTACVKIVSPFLPILFGIEIITETEMHAFLPFCMTERS